MEYHRQVGVAPDKNGGHPLLRADDLDTLNGNYIEAGDMLADGKADAAFMGGAIPIPAVVQLCSTQDVVFLPFDESVMEKLKAIDWTVVFFARTPKMSDQSFAAVSASKTIHKFSKTPNSLLK